MATIRNWDRTLAWTPDRIHRPRDTEEVASVVRRAAEQGRRVKPVGASLSWSDAADIPQDAIQMHRMASISVDPDARLVTVGAGAKLSAVNEALAEHGLSFENFGSIIMQTAGGYTGTGSHGTGGRTPLLSTFLQRMELVDGLGQVHSLDENREPDLFHAAKVHLGALGVVTSLTFRCVPAFDLEERLEVVDFDTALADIDRYVDGNDYCKFWWIPYSNTIQVYRFNKTDQPRTPVTVSERIDATGLSGRAFSAVLGITRLQPRTARHLLPAVDSLAFPPHRRVDRSDRIIRYLGAIPRHQETEYAIGREHAAAGIEAMRRLVTTATGYRVNFTQEVRFLAGDDIPMSPAYGRDSCWLGAYVASLKWAPRYFLDFQDLMADFGGRPHWGKSFDRSGAQLRGLYPRYDDFDALRAKCDPQGVFRSRFIDRVFPNPGLSTAS